MRSLIPSLILSSALFVVLGSTAEAKVVRSLDKAYSADDIEVLVLDIPVAEVQIVGGATGQFEIAVNIECGRGRRCPERAEEVRLEQRATGGKLRWTLEGYSKTGSPEVEVEVRMPADRALEVDLGVGEIDIVGLESDVSVDLGVGEVDLGIAQRHVREVHLDVGVGEADLRGVDADRSGFFFLGNEVDWDQGRGEAEIFIDIGVGEVDVDLR